MEGSWYRGLGDYWKRRKYEKLNGSAKRRRRAQVELGSTRNKRRFWRIKISPKLRVLRGGLRSPKKLLVWLRDGYVNMMLGLANSRVFSACDGVPAFGQRPAREYDEKVIVEIYKSMVAAQRAHLRDNPIPNFVGSDER